MNYKEFMQKYVGQKMHFDLGMEGYYLIDFSGSSYANGTLREVHDDFLVLYDEVEKYNLVISYSNTVVRY